jgi:Fic family protein
VPGLMTELVGWINASQASLPIPVIAGIAHYQFETIHPFYDGNGRTGRMLTTWILYRNGYELGRFYALEEFYAEDLPGYYSALVTHLHHNYYFGRHQADLTPWLNYFLRGMALVFDRIAATIEKGAAPALEDEGLALLRPLDPRARQVLGLFVTRETITSADAARLLGLSQRQTRDLLAGWVEAGWLVAADPSKRGRKYRLAQAYRGLVE